MGDTWPVPGESLSTITEIDPWGALMVGLAPKMATVSAESIAPVVANSRGGTDIRQFSQWG